MPPSRGKIAERLLPGGTEPDPRFTLGNERTFLAWIRTALALLAGGIAIEAFTADLFLEPVRKSLAVLLLLLLLGMLLSAGAGGRWIRVERSMRNKTPLPLPLIVPLLAGAGALAAAVDLVFILWR